MKNLLFGFVGGEGTGKTSQIEFLKSWLAEQGYPNKSSREPGGSARGEMIRTLLMGARSGGFSDEQGQMVDMSMARLGQVVGDCGSPYGDLAEHVLRLSSQRTVTIDLEIALFVMSRLIHFEEEIKPFMEGKTPESAFILDRFWPCTFAYQVWMRTKGCEDDATVDFMNRFFDWHVWYLDSLSVRPEFILLDVDPRIGLRRIDTRAELTSFDGLALEFHDSIREGYLYWHANSRPTHADPRFRATAHLVDTTPLKETVFEKIKEIVQLRLSNPGEPSVISEVA